MNRATVMAALGVCVLGSCSFWPIAARLSAEAPPDKSPGYGFRVVVDAK